MIGDKLILQPYHMPPAVEIVNSISRKIKTGKPYFIAVAGESGSGKSTLAIAVKTVLEQQEIKAFTFHMDDYFHLPPTSNHHQRLDDINHVGPQEVNLDLLDEHISAIHDGAKEVIKPLVHYKENELRREIFYPSDYDVFIVEGTYVSLLQNMDTVIFIDRDYKETWESRVARARDPLTPFIEEVLEIEHQIIKQHKEIADILVEQEYAIKVLDQSTVQA